MFLCFHWNVFKLPRNVIPVKIKIEISHFNRLWVPAAAYSDEKSGLE